MQFITTGNRIAVENFTLGDLYTITFLNGTYINSACIGIGENFVSFQRNEPELLFSLTMATAELVSSIELYAGGSGTNNYNDLTNKPQINDVELVGNKSLSDLGIQATISDIDTIRSGAAAGATAVQPAALAAYQTIIDSSHKLDSDLVDDTTATHKFATAAQLAQIETNKNNISFITNCGVKNFSPIKTGENTSGNKWVVGRTGDNTEPINLPVGSYIFTATSTSAGSGQCQIKLKFVDGTTQNTPTFDFGASMTLSFTTSKKVVGYGIYVNPAPVAFDNMMIRPSFTDNTYDDYAMSNAELTAAIQSLQAQLNQ